jgi:hypothetical protein
VIGGFGADLWRIRAAELQYSRCYSIRVLFTPGVVVAARVGGAQRTPAAGLRPRPAREKGFPSNLLLD